MVVRGTINQPAVPPMARPQRTAMLSQIVSGKVARPPRVVLYGPDGVGKSTFIAHAPRPLFLGSEKGTDQLDVERVSGIRTWPDMLNVIIELIENETPYKTVGIDTLDWLEPLCWAEVCRAGGKQTIEDFGFGKGYVAALDQWRVMLSLLEKLRDKRGTIIIALAHSTVKLFANPTGDDFDRYEMKLHAKAAGLWREWSDVVLFAQYEEFVRKAGNGKTNKVRAMSTGARVMHTQRTAAWDAKRRWPLPDQLNLDWNDLYEAIQSSDTAGVETVLARIHSNIPLVDETTQGKVLSAIEAAKNNMAELLRIDNKLASMTFQQSEQEQEVTE